MSLTTLLPLTGSCCIEVSGWDERQKFFVEKSEIDWQVSADRVVLLQHLLTDGALIFVRHLRPLAAQIPSAVAYVAEFTGFAEAGLHEYRLHTVQPRQTSAASIVN